ncbi:MAG: ATP-binding cassette domain-containing protein [Actinomycetaceae bacterium]|nr:ATP-binding cassette domain-containing protein [Actinomycetaceae bacterium]
MISQFNAQPVIEVIDLEWFYKKHCVFKQVNLTVLPGDLVVIRGGSGEGKTTLLNCILGLLIPKHGIVRISGVEIAKLNREKRARVRRQHIGIMFQQGGLLSGLTAEENVALPTLLNNRDQNAISRAESLLKEMAVPTGRDVESLSGGEYQRVAMARALIHEPDVLVADEPTASLDPRLRDQVYEMLRTATQERRMGTIIVTHDENAERYATKSFHLIKGELRPATN